MRGFLRIYAGLAGVGGMAIVLGLGPPWLGTEVLTRFFGAALAVLAFWAGALSEIEGLARRSKAMGWFVAGHLTVLGVLFSQRQAIWGPKHAETAGDAVLMLWLTVALMMGEFPTVSGGPSESWISCLRGTVSREPQRSRYELQIRAAGAQEERNRLARDLHDSIKQQIFVIQTAAATAQARFETDHAGAATAIEQIRDSAREAMTEMEVMMDQLRSVPLENVSLVEALKKLCEALGHRTGARVNFQLGNLPPNGTLAPGSHQAMLRVAQEALANVGRHARANNVTVSLRSLSGRVELRVQDDGAGFDPMEGQRGMGIANMRTRAQEFGGQFDVVSSPGKGTAFMFSIPEAEVPVEPRNPIYIYGAALVALVVVCVMSRSVLLSLPIFVCGVQCIRQSRKWHQARAR
jgi:signal transduction histidine kinase